MAVTAIFDPHGDDYSINTRKARNFRFVSGTFDYGTTAGGGASLDIPIGNVMGCVIEPAYGYAWKYDSGTVKAYQCRAAVSLTTAGPMSQVATGTSMATCTAIAFFAWGY